MDYEKIAEISVAKILRDFVRDEALPGTDIGAGQFWSGLAGLVGKFAPRIRDQLRFRDELQEKIDEYHRATASRPFDPASYHDFLREIGYLIPEPPNFAVRTENVLEIARVAGAQLRRVFIYVRQADGHLCTPARDQSDYVGKGQIVARRKAPDPHF